MVPLELLAPAKNLECGMAAIDHGADAVYIGAPRFGARAAAGNSLDDIRQLCDYAHSFGAKVYVTVNTILYDDELEATRQLLADLSKASVDAVLVQDMAVLQLAEGTDLCLHASTQTDNRTPEKVRWLRSQGFARAVLARELSVEEIAGIHAEVPDMELEVFVHGALCVSYSGLCYASQHCFQRSANRGECAQFCRMRFSLVDADDQEIEHERYLLSLKDMNQSDNLLELIEAGATSFKIEGRLKDVGYVKNVTAAYSQRLDAIVRQHPDKYCRTSMGHSEYTFTPDLKRTFNRGYTTYFIHGRQPDIASFDTPKAIGEFVGTVKEIRPDSFNVAGVASFANGDGLCFLNADRQFEGFRANRVAGNRIFPYKMPHGLRPGMRLYRSNDQEFERLLAGQSARRRIPIRMSLQAVEEGFELSGEISGQQQSVFLASEHLKARKSPRENLIRQLTRLGDTRYECTQIDIPVDFDYFIPNSLLAGLRRSLVEKLVSRGDGSFVRSADLTKEPSPRETYPYPYLYNISNRLSQAFYGAKEQTAYELRDGEGPIMQCRHCIRYALGYCVKHGGKRPQWREPLSLVLGDGRRFPLEFDCKNCQMNVFGDHKRMKSFFHFFILAFLLLFTSCYNKGPLTPDAWDLTKQQLDSISFYTTHHYTQNYNFVVTGDSLVVVAQQPEAMSVPDVVSVEMLSDIGEQQKDSITLFKNERIVVADIATVPTDTIDSVWVKVARDQLTFGWIHENELLAKVSPDDPISQFIDFFSDAHLLIFLAFCVMIVAAYGVRRLLRRGAKIVHFNDIPSFYPTALCLLVASSAVLYSSIQFFGPETLRHFYYHPSLNPFALPFWLGLFITSVWAIIIVAIATVDDVTRHLPVGGAILYLGGLAAICAVCYVVFSITTLYYIGYPLLIAYYVFAIRCLMRQEHL